MEAVMASARIPAVLSALAVLAVALAGTISFALPARAADLVLEDWFAGTTYARGRFAAVDGTRRAFSVTLTGEAAGDTFRLREDFAYDDGERDVKTWVFERTGERTYSGRREDVLGETTVYLSGDTADFTYRVDIAPGEAVNVVRFFDKLTLSPDGETIENTALVTKYGLPVARVEVNFARTAERAAKLAR